MQTRLSWSFLLAAALLTGLAGCGGGSGSRPSATLTWNAPTTHADGTYLDPFTTTLQYRIYYGTSSGMYTQSVDVTDFSTTVDAATPETLTVSSSVSLAPGTYYFAVTCIDEAGLESGYSNEVSRTL